VSRKLGWLPLLTPSIAVLTLSQISSMMPGFRQDAATQTPDEVIQINGK
jgi:hypothetical protein